MIGEKFIRKELDLILHLPLVERVLHPKFRRPLLGIVGGIVLMCCASLLSVSADAVCHSCCVWFYVPLLCWEWQMHPPHFLVDALAYFCHGVGALPIIRYLEPAYAIFIGAD